MVFVKGESILFLVVPKFASMPLPTICIALLPTIPLPMTLIIGALVTAPMHVGVPIPGFVIVTTCLKSNPLAIVQWLSTVILRIPTA